MLLLLLELLLLELLPLELLLLELERLFPLVKLLQLLSEALPLSMVAAAVGASGPAP